MPEVTMPRLSDSMEEGVILEWLVGDGMPVEEGDEIVEIETDKANMAFEAEASGILRHGADPGESVIVGDRIGSIDAIATSTTESSGGDPTPSASPTAARLARRVGVPLEDVSGSGAGGRVLRRDVIELHEARQDRTQTTYDTTPFQESPPRESAPPESTSDGTVPETSASPPSPGTQPSLEGRRVPLTRVQRLVAERMVASKSTIPDFSVSRAISFDAVHALRLDLKSRGERVPSYNDVLLAAVARTLPHHPLLTAHFMEGDIVYSDRVNLSVAVSTDAVLHAPVIHGADRLDLAEIASTTRRLTTLARQGHLTIDDLRGGTFTVSNLGMYGASHFTAIINGTQSAILAVGAVHEAVSVVDGAFKVGWRAELTLTCDHRIIYGAHAAAFLRDLEITLQEPQLMQ
ncbi:dihydrolipoamide acetyltransferase family protein [Nocardioides sp. AE5]|uniref:dihydrolipoamide acetyltransferase family protein n=1 Tax=Nocardioides sp. AE5 TaxID=2962573 RepID=UPI00288147DF|nr:dihydrolipoamide acetyltransferase family protein [Nocardioides sp. AE5]MDT0203155.1 dihydrolipoamide acetyltransferase family protein [Nocardioides sp. AE5]